MRGMGDQWAVLRGASDAWGFVDYVFNAEISAALRQDPVPDKWAGAVNATRAGVGIKPEDVHTGDFNLLNHIFADFGTAVRTDVRRIFTGTPFGPADFLPWDATPQAMADYAIIIYMGRGVGTELGTVEALLEYVQNGGTLVIAAGQLRYDDGSFHSRSFGGMSLGERRVLIDIPYTLLTGGTTIKTLENGDPAVMHAYFGGGEIFMFAGEYLTAQGFDNPNAILEKTLPRAAFLTFSHDANFVGYMVQHKGESRAVQFVNHGRGWFPSGIGRDHGPWIGTITLNLDRLGLSGELELFHVVKELDGSVPVALEVLEFTRHGRYIEFDMTVEELFQIFIGPVGQAASDFFK